MSLEARLALLEARAAIEDLVHGYAQLIREGRGAECGALFSDDAIFEVREASTFDVETFRVRSSVSGRDAIAAYVSRSVVGDVRVCPLISNLIIQVNGGEATSSCVMTRIMVPGGGQALGEYRDSFGFDGGVWRFSARIFTMVSAS